MTLVSHSIESAARDVAEALVPHRTDIGERVWNHIVATSPNLMSRAHTPLRLANAACHASSAALLQALANSASLEDIMPTTEVILATRALVQNGFSEDEVMSGYRVGTAYWCENWANAVEKYCPDPQLSVRVASYGTSFALGWLETVIGQVVADYREEAKRMSREGSVARAAYVRKILTDGDLDVATASRDLRYDLTGRHVAFVLSRHHDSRDAAPLDPIARTLATGLTASAPLIVRVDVDTTLCWVPADEIRAVHVPHAPALIGQGRPARGLDGFRRSHREASEAARVAHLARRPPGQSRVSTMPSSSRCAAKTAPSATPSSVTSSGHWRRTPMKRMVCARRSRPTSRRTATSVPRRSASVSITTRSATGSSGSAPCSAARPNRTACTSSSPSIWQAASVCSLESAHRGE